MLTASNVVIIVLIIAAPVWAAALVYFVARCATLGYLRARYLFDQQMRKDQDQNG